MFPETNDNDLRNHSALCQNTAGESIVIVNVSPTKMCIIPDGIALYPCPVTHSRLKLQDVSVSNVLGALSVCGNFCTVY